MSPPPLRTLARVLALALALALAPALALALALALTLALALALTLTRTEADAETETPTRSPNQVSRRPALSSPPWWTFPRRTAAPRHGQSAALAAPQLGSCASSVRARRLWAARHSQEEAEPLDTQPLPRVLAPAASKVVNSTAFDHPGAAASVISSALAFLRTRVSSPRDMSGAAAAQLRAACAVEASMAYDRLGYN